MIKVQMAVIYASMNILNEFLDSVDFNGKIGLRMEGILSKCRDNHALFEKLRVKKVNELGEINKDGFKDISLSTDEKKIEFQKYMNDIFSAEIEIPHEKFNISELREDLEEARYKPARLSALRGWLIDFEDGPISNTKGTSVNDAVNQEVTDEVTI